MLHEVGKEVRPGVFTTQDPKYDFDISIKRLVNSGTGKPIPDDVPAMTFLAHDPAACHSIRDYWDRIDNRGASPDHLQAVMDRIYAFEKFAEDHPERMKKANTTPRSSTGG